MHHGKPASSLSAIIWRSLRSLPEGVVIAYSKSHALDAVLLSASRRFRIRGSPLDRENHRVVTSEAIYWASANLAHIPVSPYLDWRLTQDWEIRAWLKEIYRCQS